MSSVTVPGLWVAFSQARISGWFITSLVLVFILAIVSAASQGSLCQHVSRSWFDMVTCTLQKSSKATIDIGSAPLLYWTSAELKQIRPGSYMTASLTW